MELYDNDIILETTEVMSFKNVVHRDNRGSLREWINPEIQSRIPNFVPKQINIVESRKNVLRGLHASVPSIPCQKLVTCAYGHILDVLVDLRVSSRNFGNYSIFNLNSFEGSSLFVPHGFAHGYLVQSDEAVVIYQLDNEYDINTEVSINALDPKLAIPWGVEGKLIQSKRDKDALNFDQLIALRKF